MWNGMSETQLNTCNQLDRVNNMTELPFIFVLMCIFLVPSQIALALCSPLVRESMMNATSKQHTNQAIIRLLVAASIVVKPNDSTID